MPVVTPEMLTEGERATLRASDRPSRGLLPRVAGPTLSSVRATLMIAGLIVVVLAPEPWFRAIAALPVLYLVHFGGWLDGRRDVSLDLLRRNLREPGRPPVERAPEERV